MRPKGAAMVPGDVPVDSIGASGRHMTYDQIEQFART